MRHTIWILGQCMRLDIDDPLRRRAVVVLLAHVAGDTIANDNTTVQLRVIRGPYWRLARSLSRTLARARLPPCDLHLARLLRREPCCGECARDRRLDHRR